VSLTTPRYERARSAKRSGPALQRVRACLLDVVGAALVEVRGGDDSEQLRYEAVHDLGGVPARRDQHLGRDRPLEVRTELVLRLLRMQLHTPHQRTPQGPAGG
jgi:hypothetical protein